MKDKELGKKGELLAQQFLKQNGFKILHTNLLLPSGEIDIVARKGKIIAIIEVKTSLVKRFGVNEFMPELRVNTRKQNKLMLLGKYYMARHNAQDDNPWEIDIVGVEINPFGAHEIRLWRQAVVE